MQLMGDVAMSGNLSMVVSSKSQMLKEARRRVFWWHVKNWLTVRWREIPYTLFLLMVFPLLKWFTPAICLVHGELRIRVLRGNERARLYRERRRELLAINTGQDGLCYLTAVDRSELSRLDRLIEENSIIEDYGTVGRYTIATAGKNYVASTFDNTAEPELFKYHGYGTGTNAAAAGDTALQTELTTEYASNSTRPTGSQAHSNATYTTVGTLSPDSGGTLAITEWGLFSASSSTTLLDRQVFSAVNLVAGSDSLQTTYVLTIG